MTKFEEVSQKIYFEGLIWRLNLMAQFAKSYITRVSQLLINFFRIIYDFFIFSFIFISFKMYTLHKMSKVFPYAYLHRHVFRTLIYHFIWGTTCIILIFTQNICKNDWWTRSEHPNTSNLWGLKTATNWFLTPQTRGVWVSTTIVVFTNHYSNICACCVRNMYLHYMGSTNKIR